MLVRYEKAARNDLEYIKKLLKDDPDALNVACPLENSQGLWNLAVGVGKVLVWTAVAFPALTLITGPFGWGIVGAHAIGCAESVYTSGKNIISRENWTLLDYAAEAGAIKVATYLILKGADTKNQFFLQMAKRNGHASFYEICSMVMLAKAQLSAEINDKQQLQSKLDSLYSEISEDTTKVEKLLEQLESQKKTMLKEVEAHAAENERLRAEIEEWREICQEQLKTIEMLSTNESVLPNADAMPKKPDSSTAKQGLFRRKNIASRDDSSSPSILPRK